MPPTPTPAAPARPDMQPGSGPPLTGYHIEDIRWAGHPPIDPTREQYIGEGLDLMARRPIPPAPIPPDAPGDYRPAVAHTPAFAVSAMAENVGTDRLGVAVRIPPEEHAPALPRREMADNALDVQRNLFRFQPGPIRDQGPLTAGGPE